MEDLKLLSDEQLRSRLEKSAAELNRRDAVSKATKEIQKILKKYSISLKDIELSDIPSTIKKRKVAVKKVGKRRKPVEPKYQSVDKKYTWSGRGRPPKWVLEACELESIDLKNFKQSDKFKFIIDRAN